MTPAPFAVHAPWPLRALAVALGVALAVGAASLLLGAAGLDWVLISRLRAPRVLAAGGVGALLALAGLALQALLRNPLADPYVLGTSGGASVGGLLALLLGASLWWGAGLGALVASGLLLLLARRALAASDDASPRLILLGAMLASVFGAVATLLLAMTPDQNLRGAVFWLVGDLSGAREGAACTLLAGVLAAVMSARGHSLDRLLLGAEAAALLGEPVRRLRLELLLVAAVATAAAVSCAGAIGFIGLVVPQALRLLGVLRSRHLALLCPLVGGTVLMAADLAARTLAYPLELPVGAVMALVGAPCFMWVLVRGGR